MHAKALNHTRRKTTSQKIATTTMSVITNCNNKNNTKITQT
jgi:hypothetical protein